MKKRNVKVIQPGLVYVIEWGAGGDTAESSSPLQQHDDSEDEREEVEDNVDVGGPNTTLSSRDQRKLRKEKRKAQKEGAKGLKAASVGEELAAHGTVYVACVFPSLISFLFHSL